jgi:peptidoglycan/LPS O-acetylase OafA/YrhL
MFVAAAPQGVNLLASSPQTRIDSLQVGRGLAALAVLLHHAEQSVERFVGDLPDPLSVAFSYGYLGVDFFFVLSGFIIYYVSHAHVADPAWPRRYAETRFTRVYLPYLPIGVAMCLAYLTLPNLASGANQWNWFSTLTLLPSGEGPALSPAWTLQHEVAFYAVAFVFLYLRKVLFGCILGGAAAIAYDLTVGGSFRSFSMIDLEFIFGIFAAWCFIHQRLRNNALLFVAGLVMSSTFFLVADRDFSVIFGLGIAMMLLPIVRIETAGHFKAGRALILLGDASFAIYLVHHPMISVLVRVMVNASPLVALVLTIAIPLVSGLLYYKLIEMPIIRLGRRSIKLRQPVLARGAT